MEEPYTIPPFQMLRDLARETPPYMQPSIMPIALVWEGVLSNYICDEIIGCAMKEEPYDFPGCDAVTRECKIPLDPVFHDAINITHRMNELWWQFDLAEEAGAWLQTYEVGGSYQLHCDAKPGLSRKLTSVLFLTDPEEYSGGTLQVHMNGYIHEIPKTRGTMCIFPAWVYHEVTPIEEGIRQTINLGFWGPDFK